MEKSAYSLKNYHLIPILIFHTMEEFHTTVKECPMSKTSTTDTLYLTASECNSHWGNNPHLISSELMASNNQLLTLLRMSYIKRRDIKMLDTQYSFPFKQIIFKVIF